MEHPGRSGDRPLTTFRGYLTSVLFKGTGERVSTPILITMFPVHCADMQPQNNTLHATHVTNCAPHNFLCPQGRCCDGQAGDKGQRGFCGCWGWKWEWDLKRLGPLLQCLGSGQGAPTLTPSSIPDTPAFPLGPAVPGSPWEHRLSHGGCCDRLTISCKILNELY